MLLQMEAMLNIYYQAPISLLTLLKMKIKHGQLKKRFKRKKHLIINFAEPSEEKSLAFLVSLC